MKVAFVSPDFGAPLASAIGESTRLLAEALADSGHRVTILASGSDRSHGAIRVMGLGESPWTRPGQFLLRWRVRRQLSRLATAEGIDRLEVPDYGGLLPWGVPGVAHHVRIHQCSTVLRADRGLSTASWLMRAERATLARARRWLVADPRAAARARTVLGIAEGIPQVVLPVPVDVHSPGAGLCPEAGRFVLFCGVRSRLKGADRFMAAAQVLRGLHPDVTWVMTGPPGDDPVPIPSDRGILDLGLRPRGEIFALMREALALVVPTRSEVQGMAAIEAAARGCPLVLPTAGPFRSWVGEDEATWVEGGDDAAWTAAVAKVLADPGRARAKARPLAAKAIATFSPAAVAAAWLDRDSVDAAH